MCQKTTNLPFNYCVPYCHNSQIPPRFLSNTRHTRINNCPYRWPLCILLLSNDLCNLFRCFYEHSLENIKICTFLQEEEEEKNSKETRPAGLEVRPPTNREVKRGMLVVVWSISDLDLEQNVQSVTCRMTRGQRSILSNGGRWNAHQQEHCMNSRYKLEKSCNTFLYDLRKFLFIHPF